MKKAWRGFTGTKWLDEVNMRQFIQDNYDSYDGDASFLEKPTEATDKLWGLLPISCALFISIVAK